MLSHKQCIATTVLMLALPAIALAQPAAVITLTPPAAQPAPSAEGVPTSPNVPPVPSTAPDAKVVTPNEATSTTIPDQIETPVEVHKVEEKSIDAQQQRELNEVKSGTVPVTATPDGRGGAITPTTPRRSPVWNGVDGRAD